MKQHQPRKSVSISPAVDEQARAILADLRARRDSVRAQGTQRYFKETIVSLGLDAATVREIARERWRQLKPTWTLAAAVALCDRLLQEPELEVRGLGLLIVARFKKEFGSDLLPTAQHWLETRLDNWALVDSFCSLVLSPLLEKSPAAEATLRRWSQHRCLWVRRAAVVTLIPFARRGRHLNLAYELAQAHFADPEDLMHKATGWLLREAGKTDATRLAQFLHEHGPTIPRTALRYAIERFPLPERRRLLEQTKS